MNKILSVRNKMAGEYRAVLTGADGRVKYDSGWQPNMVLDQGPWLTLSASALSYCCLGDSATAAVSSQTGIQGTFLAGVAFPTGTITTNSTVLPYYFRAQCSAVFTPGVGTGTIREYSLAAQANSTEATLNAAVRVVLTAPIVKGASDQLTIEHRLYLYFDTTPITATINISGTDYDLEMRYQDVDTYMYNVQATLQGIVNRLCSGPATNGPVPYGTSLINGVFPVTFNDLATGTTGPGFFDTIPVNTTVNGTPPYREVTLKAGVDVMNGDFDMFSFWQYFNVNPAVKCGRVVQILSTIGGNPFTKENTHEFTFTYRNYLDIYIP